jgi:tRNA(Ile)-lysidine synthase TilS/MesJ
VLDVAVSAAGLGGAALPAQELLLPEGGLRGLRWFLYPQEALRLLQGGGDPPSPPPFEPKRYRGTVVKVAVAKVAGAAAALATPTEEQAATDQRLAAEAEAQRAAMAAAAAGTDGADRARAEAEVLLAVHRTAEAAAAAEQQVAGQVPASEGNGSDDGSAGGAAGASVGPRAEVEAAWSYDADSNRFAPAGQAAWPAARDGPSSGSTESPGRPSATSSWKFHKPGKAVLRKAYEAVVEHGMIQEGDRILVGVSGGKDSLALVHVLQFLKQNYRWLGVKFDFGCVTVDPQTEAFDPSPLKVYFEELGIPYFYEEQCIIQAARNAKSDVDSICSFCSKLKRGRLYATMRREGYNVLALGQHLDDLAESFLMAAFHNGFLRTMKAHSTPEQRDLRVIRPFVYTRERDLAAFAAQHGLPVIAENCPACFSAPKERARTKQLLAAQVRKTPSWPRSWANFSLF